jgi:hypothetical protein
MNTDKGIDEGERKEESKRESVRMKQIPYPLSRIRNDMAARGVIYGFE